jgi:hypothetical protein
MVRSMVGQMRRRRRRRAVARKVSPILALVGIGAVLLALLVGAVSKIGSSSHSYERTVNNGYSALAAPYAAQSNSVGKQLNSFMDGASGLDRVTFFSQLDSFDSSATTIARQFGQIVPPYPSAGASPDCERAMNYRAQAVSGIRASLEGLLGGSTGTAAGAGDEAAATTALESDGSRLVSADSSWASCRHKLRSSPGSARLASSVWVNDPSLWTSPALAAFASAVVSSSTLAASPGLGISSVVTVPSPSAGPAGTLVVEPTTGLQLNVVVQDLGNVSATGVSVTATTTPTAPVPGGSGSRPSHASQRATVDLDAGSSTALSVGGLSVFPGASYVLQVSASATGVSAPPATFSLQIQQAVSTIVVVPSSTVVGVGQKVTYTASVSSSQNGLTPTGTVVFQADNVTIPSCPAVAIVDSKATCTVSYPATGEVTITALYSGDPSNSGSTSVPITEKVSAPSRPSHAGLGEVPAPPRSNHGAT